MKISERLDTGSSVFNSLLFGGLPTRSVTDVFGAAATGKTQFAFQNALFCAMSTSSISQRYKVVFVDCAGSFRPERIAEMAEIRGISGKRALDRISSFYARSVVEQRLAIEKVLNSPTFDECKLLIVDDVTTNFVAEYPGTRNAGEEDDFIQRHYELSSFVWRLAYIALTRSMAVLLTNSVRTRLTENPQTSRGTERETTGDIISQFCVFRLHFSRDGRTRHVRVVQPYVSDSVREFGIEGRGINP